MAVMQVSDQNELSKFHSWATKIEDIFYNFFKILTICPIQRKRNSFGVEVTFQKSSRIIAFLMILGICHLFCGVLIVRILFISAKFEFGVWTESTNISIVTATCLIILIETQCSHASYMSFLKLKETTENELNILCGEKFFVKEKYLFIRSYLRMFLIYQIIAWIIDTFCVLDIKNNSARQFYNCCLVLPITYNRQRSFQHQLHTLTINFYLKLVRKKMEKIVCQLKNPSRQQHPHQFFLSNQKIIFDLKLSMRIYESIFRMSQLINEIFACSLLMSFLEKFIRLLSNSFWIYYNLFNKNLTDIPGSHEYLQFKSLEKQRRILK